MDLVEIERRNCTVDFVLLKEETHERSEIHQRRLQRSFEVVPRKQNLGDTGLLTDDAPHEFVVIVLASTGIKPVLLITAAILWTIVATLISFTPVLPIHAVPDVNPRFAITRRKLGRSGAIVRRPQRDFSSATAKADVFQCAQG